MSNKPPPVLLCRPIDLTPLLAIVPDIPESMLPKMYVGSIEGKCEGCGAAVWVGPRQQTMLKPGVSIACMTCAAVAGMFGHLDPNRIIHLGNTHANDS